MKIKRGEDMTRNICIDIDGTMTSPYFFIPYLNKLTGKNLGIEDYTSMDQNIARCTRTLTISIPIFTGKMNS